MSNTDSGIYPMAYGLMLLRAMQGKRMYEGTVDPVTVAERRAKNRLARKARRTTKKRSR
jgi:hypothetical protein